MVRAFASGDDGITSQESATMEPRGPQYEHGLVWTVNRLFAMNRDVTDAFYLREGTGNLFELTNQGRVKLSQFERMKRNSL